ncbi:MAG: fadD, partial [Phenylobacterium sp.]|nr:fadD [Phenylobacterium sp.]
WTGLELDYGLTDAGAKVAVMDAERYERLAEHLPNCRELKRVYVSRASEEIAHPQVTLLESVLGGPNDWKNLPDQPPPAVEIGPEDPVTIFYTSGTTGKPKGALGGHRALNCNIFTAMAAAARIFLRRGEAPPAPDPGAPQRVSLISVPFFHVTGCIAALNPSVFAGNKLVMMHKWDVVRAFELIEREKINQAGGVPTIAWQILEHPARTDYDLSSLDALAYGGAPAAPELVRRLKETFPNLQAAQGWGMTETTGTVTSNGGEDYLNRPDSCGPAVMVCELQIRDADDGRTVFPAGQVGELWSKGPMNAFGYWNKPEPSAQTFVDGWVRTGDLARLDEEGFCFIIDRAKDMLIRGGENIYCVEVENALYDHPAVMDAAVVGVPHRTLGEEPAAVVTLKPGTQATEDELRAHVAERLAAFKVPVRIRFWTETLPRNPNGKILKSELRKLFAEEQAPA